MAHDVFVSYSQPDRAAAFALAQRVEARGIRVWIAPRDVTPGADWAAEIIDAITNARLMVLVFSGNSNDSGQVRREVERAAHKQLPILPFRIEDVLPSKSLEYFLSTQHWMDAFPPPCEPHIDRLCDYLETAVGAAPARALPATRPATDSSPGGVAPTLVDVSTAQLHLVEIELARWIGPIARPLVRRAARDGGDLGTIALRLAPEIDRAADRQAFLAACWRIGKDA
jgi:TIR domain